MKLLLKQITKTFLKNGFLIAGLSVLLSTLGFTIFSCINISTVFSNSVNKLNKEGNAAKVVSSDKKTDFGHLQFSYKLSDQDPINIFVSSLSLVPDKDSTNSFSRENNTIFPYTKEQLYRPNDTKMNPTLRKGLDLNSGITYNANSPDLENMFSFDLSDPAGIWNFPWTLTLAPPLSSVNPKAAIAFSLVGNNKKVTFNPQNIIFDKNGNPCYSFNGGFIREDFDTWITFASLNEDEVFTNHPNFIDNNGYGIVDGYFNRFKKRGFPSSWHDFESKIRFTDNESNLFGQFVKKKSIIPYTFTINLDSEQSYGPIVEYIKLFPEVIEQSFNKVFHYFQLEQTGINDNSVHNVFEIKKEGNKYSIIAALPDEFFVDVYDSNNIQKTEKNKVVYLKSFSEWLSNKFSENIYDHFNENFIYFLDKNNITKSVEKETLYRDVVNSQDFLFVPKGNNSTDKLVIYGGSNMGKIGEDPSEILKYANGIVDRDLYVFPARKKLWDLIDEQNIPKQSNNESKIKSEYSKFFLVKYLFFQLNKIVESQNSIKAILNSPYYKLMKLFYINFSNQIDNIKIEVNYDSSFNTINSWKTYNISFYNNLFVVLSNSYALANDKKYLPTYTSQDTINLWINKIDEIKKLPQNEHAINFNDWLDSIKNTDMMTLSPKSIMNIFNNNKTFFEQWKNTIDDRYVINYKKQKFLISGFGISPDFSFPLISPTSPIPNPKNQAIVYTTNSAFDGLDIPESDKIKYYSYSSNFLSPSQIISKIKQYSISMLGKDIIKPTYTKDSDIGSLAMRTYFPTQVTNLVVIMCILGAIFISLLSLIIIYFLTKSFLKNLLEPVSICLANGISIKKVISTCLINFGIITAISTFIAYVIANLVQSSLIGILGSIWFIPTTLSVFNPLVTIGIASLSFIVFGSIFSWIIYKKFNKKSVNDILANKLDIKMNKLTNFLRINKIKIPSIFKLSSGFSIVNIKKLTILALFGSIVLGGFVSSIMIKDKFTYAKKETLESRSYNYQYNLSTINESSGLFKTQNFNDIGTQDPEVGIMSLYSSPNSLYKESELKAKTIPFHGDKTNIVEDSNKLFSNLIYPSMQIYQKLTSNRYDTLFNSNASLFLLDFEMPGLGNIWQGHIKQFFPTWIANQMEYQLEIFKQYVMQYYGEWFFEFLNKNTFIENKNEKPETIVKYLEVSDNNNNQKDLILNNVSQQDSGYYYLMGKTANNKLARTKPYFVWVDSKQIYWDKDITNINHRFEPNSGTNISIDASNDKFYRYTNNNGFKTTTIVNEQLNDLKWVFIPAYKNYITFNSDKIKEGVLTNTRLSKEFMQFVTTIYNNKDVSKNDAKVLSGIIPFNDKEDEKFTYVNGSIIMKNGNKVSNNDQIEILGIQPESKFVILSNNDKDISNRIFEQKEQNKPNPPINIIINNPAAIQYGLGVNDVFTLQLSNNMLDISFQLLGNLLTFNNNPIDNKIKFKIVGINDDAYGPKFYIDQLEANRILGLNEAKIYSKISPNDEARPEYAQVETVSPNINDYKARTIPFNGIFSKNPKLTLSNNFIPLYTYGNIWSTTNDSIRNIIDFTPLKILYEFIVSHNNDIIKSALQFIKTNIDNSVNITNDPTQDRNNLITFLINKYSVSSVKNAIKPYDAASLLSPNLKTVLPNEVLYELFDISSNLANTLIIIISSILIPLLLIVSILTSIGILNDLLKQLGLMRVLGYSARNVLFSLGLLYLPVFGTSFAIGVGLMFLAVFAFQKIIYGSTSIFVTSSIYPGFFFIGIGLILAISLISLAFVAIALKRKKLENSIKF